MSEDLYLKDPSVPTSCKECGGEIEYMGLGSYKCKECGHMMYDDYGKVRNYLDAHKGATQAEVSFETGVSQHKIRQMIKEEKFEIAQNSAVFMFCELCGATIRSGRFCENCAKKIAMAEAKTDRRATAQNMSGFGGLSKGDSGARRFSRD